MHISAAAQFLKENPELPVSLAIIAGYMTLAWCAPQLSSRVFSRLETWLSRVGAKKSRAVSALFLAVITVRLLLLPLIPIPVPGLHDEFSYLLQADTFAHGRLANPPHPMWMSFETFHENWFPTYSGMFPPAQSMVLALGQFLGHPWIGVLLSDAAMCAAVLWMLQAWLPARWALLGGVIASLKLGIISYWMNSYWGGAVAAAGGALVLGALPRIFRCPRVRDALLLGLGVAILANSRPYEGVVFCLAPAGTILWWFWKSSRMTLGLKLRNVVAPVALLFVLTGAFIGYYNWRLTANVLLLPHTHNWRTYLASGLFVWETNGPKREYRNPQFDEYYSGWARKNYERSFQEAIRISLQKLSYYADTYFWPGALLLIFSIPKVFHDRKMKLLVETLLISVVGLFIVVWSLPHYAAPLVGVFYALLIQGVRHVRVMRFVHRPVGVDLSRLMFLFLVGTVAIGLVHRVQHPEHWNNWNGEMGMRDRANVLKTLDRMPGKHLAIVRYGPGHDIHKEWVYNAADIDGSKVVWAREMDAAQNQKLLDYYRDRQVWLMQPERDSQLISPYYSPRNRKE